MSSSLRGMQPQSYPPAKTLPNVSAHVRARLLTLCLGALSRENSTREDAGGFLSASAYNSKHEAYLGIADQRIGSMQDIEKQRFEQLRVLAHALKIEALEPRKADGALQPSRRRDRIRRIRT